MANTMINPQERRIVRYHGYRWCELVEQGWTTAWEMSYTPGWVVMVPPGWKGN